MKHRFNSTYADGSDATLVKPSNWNDTHVFGIRSVSASGATTIADDVILATGGAGGIALSLPNPTTCSGQPIVYKKVDSGAGFVTINPFASETIDGQSSYVLVNQYQYVEVMSDGTNWQLINNN
jgi:hypothetical protein